MEQKNIETLTLKEIKNRLEGQVAATDMPMMEPGFAMLYGGKRQFGKAAVPHCPYRLPGIRIGLFIKGEAQITLNLIPRHLSGNTLTFFCDGAILQIDGISNDSDVRGVLVEPWLMNELFPQGVPAMFNGQVKDALMSVDDSTFAKIQLLE